MNGFYIREMPLDELVRVLTDYVSDPVALQYLADPGEENAAARVDVLPYVAMLRHALANEADYAKAAIGLEQERVQTLTDFGLATAFFFQQEPEMDEKAVAKWFNQPHVADLFDHLIERLANATTTSVEWCEMLIRNYAEAKGFEKLGPVVHPVRVALTGKTVGPGLFELMNVLGPARMLHRLRLARRQVR
jgi:glutamyl-tRNA synthetase